MLRKFVASVVVVCLLSAMAPVAHAKLNPEKQARFAEKVRAGIAQLGVGQDTRVQVQLRDKTKLKGFIRSADQVGFEIADARTGAVTAIAYSDVSKVKGHNLSTGAQIAITAAITVGVVLAILAIIVAAAGDS